MSENKSTQSHEEHGGHGDHGLLDDSDDRRPGRATALASQHGPEMARAHSSSAHDHSAHDPGQFKRKFWLTLALTIPTVVFSHGLQEILGLTGPRFPGSHYIPAVFGVAVFFYGGWVFLTGAVSELRARKPGMMTLISLAILVAFGYSSAVTLGLNGMDFWWELGTLITIMLLGHWLEMAAVMGAQDALGELAKLIPDEAEQVVGDSTEIVRVAELALGDHVLVRPGARIPVDGQIIDGASDVDEALLTGESTPVEKAVGATVIAGSINGGGSLTVRVDKLGDDTALAGVMKMVAEAQASKSGAQILADRAAAWLFYLAIAAALITLVVWLLLRPDQPNFVLERVVTVLVIACPHALGLAIPLVAQISTSLGAKNGLLIKNRSSL
ncbi:MAG: HAD-IC family P-type ATPase, partial [Terrimesophilobacter sp.]